ncbi:MAG: hypothetical protein ACKOW8_05680, partial [Flavobacteriales bacterium]
QYACCHDGSGRGEHIANVHYAIEVSLLRCKPKREMNCISARGNSDKPIIQVLFLHLLMACRVGIALNLWQLASASQLPEKLVIIAVIIELIWGISALILAIPSVRKSIQPNIKKMLHYTGFATALALCLIFLLAAPGKWQLLSFERPNYAFMHFPFVWLPSVVWPICAWAHLVLAKKPVHSSIAE